MDDTPSLEERGYILSKVFQSIPLYFAHWEDATIGKGQLDAAFQRLLNEALLCNDRKRFSLLLMAFMAKLNNGHTRFRDSYFMAMPPLGMALRPVDDRWLVIASDLPQLQAGDVIQRIEGKAIEAWYEELRPYTVGSPQARTAQFGELKGLSPALIRIFLPERYTVAFEDARGVAQTLTVDRAALGRDAIALRTEGRWLEEGLAYVKVPSFRGAEFEQRAVAYAEEFSQARCIIVDVRGNEGGSTPGALTRALMDRPYRWWAESSPLTVGLLAYEAQRGHGAGLFASSQLLWRSPASEPDPEAYKGRLIILADRATWSAGEDFVMPFKDNGRAVIVGETTGGSTGQPYQQPFDNGMGLTVGTKRVYLPDGGRFEGVGLAPDIAVHVRREDLYAGRDPVLERATAVARGQEVAA
jgi:carboxyl-terminal processing protease